MVSVCLPSDALLQHLPSYLGFSYLGHGVSLHGCSSKAEPLVLILDEGYLLTGAPSDIERGIAPLGPPVPAQPLLLGCGVAPPGCHPWPRTWVAPLGHSCALSVSPTQSRVGSIIGATLTLRVKFAQDIPFVHDSQPALWNWLKVKVTQSCSTVCDPMDYTVRGILQARILDRVAFPFSRGSSQPRDRTQVSSTARGFFTSWATRGKFC